MPYILVRGNLASYGAKSPWRVLVSGLKATDIDQLKRFASGGYCDDSTIVYMQHPCVILTALEVLGYKVVASSSTSVKQDYNEYMWTMRREFSEPDPLTVPDPHILMSTTSNYVAIKASLHASSTAVFGLSREEDSALTKRFKNFRQEIPNGVLLKECPITVVNALSELGYKVVSTTGESEIVWTMQRDV
ncbi:hypothetical protein FQR65_LT01224 [Abscondita terminalis]|nr:hypothetical protein FQR65_LT01224 [Abscondita terminalis]